MAMPEEFVKSLEKIRALRKEADDVFAAWAKEDLPYGSREWLDKHDYGKAPYGPELVEEVRKLTKACWNTPHRDEVLKSVGPPILGP